MEHSSTLEPYLHGDTSPQATYPRLLKQRAKLGVATCALVVAPLATVEGYLGDTPIVDECQVQVTDQTKIEVEKLLDNPISMNVAEASYRTDHQVKDFMATKAETLGLHVIKPDKTLEQIKTNNETLAQSQAAKANLKATRDFLGKYGVDLTTAHTFSDLTQRLAYTNEDTLYSNNTQDMLPRLVQSFSYLPVEYVTEVAKLDRIAFAKWYFENPTIAYAHQPYPEGPRTIYINADKAGSMVTTVDNLVQHEIGHHTIAELCNADTLDIRKDAQLNDENMELPYTGDTSNASAQQTARSVYNQPDNDHTTDVNFVSEYSSTAFTENQAELISYVTAPPRFGVATSKRFPKVRMQAAHILGLLYQKNPQVAKYFIAVGNRR